MTVCFCYLTGIWPLGIGRILPPILQPLVLIVRHGLVYQLREADQLHPFLVSFLWSDCPAKAGFIECLELSNLFIGQKGRWNFGRIKGLLIVDGRDILL